MDVLIVGAGSMGRWFGRAIDADVSFADVDAETAAAAADVVGGDVVDLGGETTFDVVCLAVPMTHVVEAIEEHADRAERAVVDVSGVMGPPVRAMETHAPNGERVSLHPLFAPERAPGSIAVVRDRPGPTTDELLETIGERGNEFLETTADEHDEAMETVQASAHAAILSFALASKSVPDGFETPVYDRLRAVAEQVTDGTPQVYADIQETFDGADAVAVAASDIAAADSEELEALYREAAHRLHGSERTDDVPAGTDTDTDSGETR
ncbi:prephenate dehydrogenase/arogenate dehydrogenase family protein [Natrarchaeobius chitinivorans]|uniref:Prephenate dehydrogenase n=1 Tax=Natrarchaeobius chitinivorans TaxID=1679083 RepID=A0A3N6PAM7_NATCH|nr:prephenate dehydrogenase/arogenate dehydrogenase family protein [Natrarchaeobius chitinivorans]RQG93455.1 prephenate dehydrogenase [Natrarchaeobius chitinivorans]